MNAKKLITISGLALTGAMFLGCEDRTNDSTAAPPADTATDTSAATSNTARDTTYASPAAGAYTDERRDEFVEAAEQQHEALEEELAAIAAEAEAQGDAAMARFHQVKPTLEGKLRVVEQRLDAVRDATAATWTELEQGHVAALNDVRASFAEAGRHGDPSAASAGKPPGDSGLRRELWG